MRIISKFRDYYDGVQGMGVDKEVVYVREPEELYLWRTYNRNIKTSENLLVEIANNLPNIVDIGNHARSYRIWFKLIGFCGEWLVIGNLMEYEYGVSLSGNRIFRSDGALLAILEDINSRHLWEWYDSSKKAISCISQVGLCDVYSFVKKSPKDLFAKYNAPIIVVDHERTWRCEPKVVANGNIGDHGFMKILDPYTCYQEIAMYVSGVMSKKDNDMVDISDNDMRDKKGFDKWSFRKMGLNSK